MSGTDIETNERRGGWKSLRMVERYPAVSDEHMAAALAKLACWAMRGQCGMVS